MQEKPRWVRVAEADNLPFSKSLIYKWHHKGENLHLFSKVGGCLFIDMNAMDALFEAGRREV
jgi:hypothetical protein